MNFLISTFLIPEPKPQLTAPSAFQQESRVVIETGKLDCIFIECMANNSMGFVVASVAFYELGSIDWLSITLIEGDLPIVEGDKVVLNCATKKNMELEVDMVRWYCNGVRCGMKIDSIQMKFLLLYKIQLNR